MCTIFEFSAYTKIRTPAADGPEEVLILVSGGVEDLTVCESNSS
jgi:hypothetical protein